MQTVTVHTTQNIGIDYEVAGLGERIVALLIDYALFVVLAILGLFLISSGSNVLTGGYYIGIGALFVFYDLLCEMLFNGQSVGKRIMKIKVISIDGGRPSFGQYLIRWLFRLVDCTITGYVGGLLCAALSKNVQRIGDMIAGTTLIKTRPRTQMENLVFKPSADDYEPVFKEAIQLNDSDMALINEVIHNYYKTGNTTIVYSLAGKLKEHLNITLPSSMNDMVFLQTLLKDYTHLISFSDSTINS